MEKIERKPLPPPNATVAKIAEAERAEMIARANEVIDHYLNGPGSYWDTGTRKPLHEPVRDLSNFKNQVIASKQLADDPTSVMDSIIKLIEQTTEQVEEVTRNGEGRDRIAVPYLETNDPIDDPRVISPLELSNGALSVSRRLPRRNPSLAVPSPSEFARPAGLVSSEPMSFYSVQPPIWDVADRSAPNEDADDWLVRLLQDVRGR